MGRGAVRLASDATDVMSTFEQGPGYCPTLLTGGAGDENGTIHDASPFGHLLTVQLCSTQRLCDQFLGTVSGVDRDADEALAWLELHQAAATLRGELSRRLETAAEMSAAEYDVLWYLANAVDRRLTMSELAARLVLSRSGTTRLVDRLVQRGWVERELSPDNRRIVFAVLTPDGVKATRRGFMTVRLTRDELFGSRLDSTDVADLRRVLGKLLRRLDLIN